MTVTTRTRTTRARLAAVVGGLATIAALGMTAPAATAAPDDGAPPVQVPVQTEAVTSDEPVMVKDVAASAAPNTLYCAVLDGRNGCFDRPIGQGLVVAKLYRYKEFKGRTVVIYNPEYRVGCTARTTDHEGGSTLNKRGTTDDMSNRVTSVRTFNHCDVKLFDGSAYGGDRSGWIHKDANLGAMDNRASSFKIS